MPELPEVEVVRRGVERWASGRRVEQVEVLDERSLRRHPGDTSDFTSRLAGVGLGAARRRGKYLWVPLTAAGADSSTEPSQALVVHLGMSGQLLLGRAEDPQPRHLRIRLALKPVGAADDLTDDAPAELRFADQRIFGGMALDRLETTEDVPSETVPSTVAHIARDPLDEHFDAEALYQRLRKRRTGIKRALLDQTLVSGIGNIYADEALWHAGLHYERGTQSLRRAEALRLIEAAQDVMLRALEQGGTSFDSLYVNVNGESGYFSRSLEVYGRGGQPCSRCGTPVVREKFMNRSSYLCPVCQRLS